MRKLLVKLINLLYIAAAGVAIYALCTRPIFKATIHAHLTQDQMGAILTKAFSSGDSSESSESSEEESRAAQRVSTPQMSDYINKDNVATYFPNGYDLVIPVEIPAKSAFELHNTKLLDELLQNNLYKVVDNIVDSIADPIQRLFKDIVKGFAVDALKEEINKQIAEKFPDGAEASEEEIQAVFDNVYSLLEEGESVSVDDLASTILHGKDDGNGGTTGGVLDIINSRGSKYVAFDPQPTEEEVEADRTAEGDECKYYVAVVSYAHNEKEYSETETYFEKLAADSFAPFDPQPSAEEVEADRAVEEESWTYYVQSVEYVHNTEAYDGSVTYFDKQPYTNSDIDEDKITEEMVNSLESIDGLVTKVPVLCDPQPSQEEVEADIAKENEKDRIYYILDGENNPVLPTEYSSSATYYTVNKVVNDVDSALDALIESFLGGSGSGNSRAIMRDGEQLQSAESESSLKEAIKAYLYKMIPQNISDSSGAVATYAPYALLALVVLFALPWAWFALVTLLRTLRRDKCWTRLGIVIWGALLQVILGILLTYGGRYLWPYLASKVDALKEYANAINFDVRTGCLIPSFVWLGIVVSAIPYWMLRRPLKYRAKVIRKNKKHERYLRQRERYINSEEH